MLPLSLDALWRNPSASPADRLPDFFEENKNLYIIGLQGKRRRQHSETTEGSARCSCSVLSTEDRSGPDAEPQCHHRALRGEYGSKVYFLREEDTKDMGQNDTTVKRKHHLNVEIPFVPPQHEDE